MAAVEGDRLAGPQLGEYLKPLIQELGADGGTLRLPGGGERRIVDITGTNAEYHSAPTEVIQSDGLARQLPWAAARQRGDRHPETHPAGGDRHGCQRDPGIVGGRADLTLVDDV